MLLLQKLEIMRKAGGYVDIYAEDLERGSMKQFFPLLVKNMTEEKYNRNTEASVSDLQYVAKATWWK